MTIDGVDQNVVITTFVEGAPFAQDNLSIPINFGSLIQFVRVSAGYNARVALTAQIDIEV